MMNLFSRSERAAAYRDGLVRLTRLCDQAAGGENGVQAAEDSGVREVDDLARAVNALIALAQGGPAAELRRAREVCVQVTRGDLEARILNITDDGPLGELMFAINDVIDISDAFAREVGACVEAVKNGIYYRRIRRYGLLGEYRRFSGEVNAAVAEMGARNAEFREVTAKFTENVGHVITEAEAMKDPVGSVEETARETAQRCTHAAQQAAGALEAVQSVAVAAEELTSSISEINEQVGRSAAISHEAAEEARHTNETVQSLVLAAGRIDQVVTLINEIADRTNLLALNATIEAARAGEAGKGFTVVASEVKSLSRQTAEATSEIAQQVLEMKGALDKTLEVANAVSKTIGEVNEVSGAIAAAIEEQSAVTQEISRSAQIATRGTEEVTGNISHLEAGAEEAGAAVERLAVSSSGLSQNAGAVQEELGDFLARVS